MEEVKVQTWNKKRILMAVFLLLILTVAIYFFRTKVLIDPLQQIESVKGVSTSETNAVSDIKINIQDTVKERIDSLKQEVSGLDIMEIASSSPQVQKILNDIKSLEQYPGNQAKEICRQICGL